MHKGVQGGLQIIVVYRTNGNNRIMCPIGGEGVCDKTEESGTNFNLSKKAKQINVIIACLESLLNCQCCCRIVAMVERYTLILRSNGNSDSHKKGNKNIKNVKRM